MYIWLVNTIITSISHSVHSDYKLFTINLNYKLINSVEKNIK